MISPTSLAGLANLAGVAAASAYRELLLAHDSIDRIWISQYETPPSLQQRIQMTQFERDIVTVALEIREKAMIPFWEAVFAACLRVGKCSEALLSAASFHHGPGRLSLMSRDEVINDGLSKMTQSADVNTGLSSRVLLKSGEEVHLQMMDFRCDVSKENTRIVSAVCQRIMPGGSAVLDSGDSYHACGIVLVSASERVEFLAKSLLYAPIVDSVYVAHQLSQSASAIRISLGGTRKKTPTVLRMLLPES